MPRKKRKKTPQKKPRKSIAWNEPNLNPSLNYPTNLPDALALAKATGCIDEVIEQLVKNAHYKDSLGNALITPDVFRNTRILIKGRG